MDSAGDGLFERVVPTAQQHQRPGSRQDETAGEELRTEVGCPFLDIMVVVFRPPTKNRTPSHRKSVLRLQRLLPAVAIALLFILRPWEGIQLSSYIGRAEAATTCVLRPAIWEEIPPPPRVEGAEAELRAMTWNLHAGQGPDWSLYTTRAEVETRLHAIAGRIHTESPDLVALNEVDFGSRRSGWLDQAAYLAAELKRLSGQPWRVVPGITWRRHWPGMEVRFGNAILVRHPIVHHRDCLLGHPCGDESMSRYASADSGGWLARLNREPRGVVEVEIDFHGRPITLLATHLEPFVVAKREAQAQELLERFVVPGATTLLLGDMNSVDTRLTAARPLMAADRSHDLLGSGSLLDARERLAALAGYQDLATWASYPADAPRWPLDGAFASSDLVPLDARVIGGLESDHLGLSVRFALVEEPAAAAHRIWQQALGSVRRTRLKQCDGFSESRHVGRVVQAL